MSKIGIFYATGKGDTQKACEYLASKLTAEILPVKDAGSEDFLKFDLLILASPSYGFGELQKDWEAKLETLKNADLSGKKVAILAVGNQERHPDSFCGGAVEFLPYIKKARLIGAMPNDGYKFDHSQSFINGKFIGLAIDTKGDAAYEAKLDKWAKQLKAEL
ncbi:flavodoxin domain-containing protein [Campylobacter sp. FOBRC14]|uniref:flavodoxin domain-containing protein n=1 Tax=Campylobacter sp. FOBRC14 TaxID=936554 RepID=UPI00027A3953|nr:flavodoxin domain-containing protein [Campylobacter sp. FOBRC14]EJP74458.1 putative flavodoxin [Campylobacter sp. FOBRC14]